MLIFLFSFFCDCSQRKFNIKTAQREYQLGTFGFTDNATFDIELSTKYKTTIIIFMAKYSEIKEKALHEISFLDLCSDHNIHFANINSTYHNNTTYVHFKGLIPSKNIYYPYILNCNYSRSAYYVITDYRNNNSHIDTRDNLYPYFYIILSFIYLLLTVLCLINFFHFSSFGIIAQPTLAIILCSKAVIMAAYSRIWVDRYAGIKSYDYHGTILFNIAYLFHYTSFFAFPAFIIAGWCIYRDFIPMSETLINISSSLVFVVGVWSFRFTVNIKEAFISITLVIIGFVSMFKNNLDYIMMTSKLDDIAPRNIQYLRSKIDLVFHFDAAFVLMLIALGIFLSVAVSLNLWDIVLDIIFEFLLLMISLVEIFMFLYRSRYEGNENYISENLSYLNQHDMEGRDKFITINEPKSSFLALIR